MTRPLRVLPQAEAELRAAAEWYDDRAGLGDELVLEVQTTAEGIAAAPEAFAPASGVHPRVGARQAAVNRFPYRVIFVVLVDEIRIVAVAHTRRRPGYWRDRLPGH